MAIHHIDQFALNKNAANQANALPSGSLASFAAQQQLSTAMKKAGYHTSTDTFSQQKMSTPIHLANSVAANGGAAHFGMKLPSAKAMLMALMVSVLGLGVSSCGKDNPITGMEEPGPIDGTFNDYFDVDNAEIINRVTKDSEGRLSSVESEVIIPSKMAGEFDIELNGTGKANVQAFNFNNNQEITLPEQEFTDLSVLADGSLKIVAPFAISDGSTLNFNDVTFTVNQGGGNENTFTGSSALQLRGGGQDNSPEAVSLRFYPLSGGAPGAAHSNFNIGAYSTGQSPVDNLSNDHSYSTVPRDATVFQGVEYAEITPEQAEANATEFVTKAWQADGTPVSAMPWAEGEDPNLRNAFLDENGEFSPQIAAAVASLSGDNSPFTNDGLSISKFVLPENNATGKYVIIKYDNFLEGADRPAMHSYRDFENPETGEISQHSVIILNPNLKYSSPFIAASYIAEELGHVPAASDFAQGIVSTPQGNSVTEEITTYVAGNIGAYAYANELNEKMGLGSLADDGNVANLHKNGIITIHLVSGQDRDKGVAGIRNFVPEGIDGFGANSVVANGAQFNSFEARVAKSYPQLQYAGNNGINELFKGFLKNYTGIQSGETYNETTISDIDTAEGLISEGELARMIGVATTKWPPQ